MNAGDIGRFFTSLGLNGSDGPFQFATPLGPLAWAVLGAVPVGIVALYFLKLRRTPLRVPSTLLWRKSIEDIHVNSLFQRLRRNLLLLLQLLAVLLILLALSGLRMRGTASQGKRVVIAVDDSASMTATDVAPSRLSRAKEAARNVINGMAADDLAMVIAFNDKARVVSNYTSDRKSLLARIDAIQGSQATTSLRDALQVAAGLANPSKQFGEGVVATSVETPKLLIYTDGGFPDVDGFSLGNLEPTVNVIGPPPVSGDATKAKPAAPDEVASAGPPSDNVALLAFQARKNDEKTDLYQVFGRLKNYRAEPVETEAKLFRHDPDKPADAGTLIDAIALKVPARGEQSFTFDLPASGPVELEARVDVADAQPLDNKAFALVGNPRKAQVLLATPGNRYLSDTLQTPLALERSEVTVITPEQLKADPFARDTRAGKYDLVVYDRCRPEAPPDANTLYFGALPPGPAFEKSKVVDNPVILDWDAAHPLMQFVRDLPNVAIAKAIAVDPPPGSTVLIEGNKGPLAFVTPREGFTDAVVTFGLLDGTSFNTTWFKNYSFPLFLFNSLQTLGNSSESLTDEVHLPGRSVTLRVESPEDAVQIVDPAGNVVETVKKSPQGSYVVTGPEVTGVYHARWGKSGVFPFVVNQFDPREADLAPRGLVPEGTPEAEQEAYKIKIGYQAVAGNRTTRPVRHDWWRWLAASALAMLAVEWYVYNRRVYV